MARVGSAYQRREPSYLEVTAPCQAVSAALNFLRPSIQECIAVSMNHHTGQTGGATHVLPSKVERMAILRQVLSGVFGAPR